MQPGPLLRVFVPELVTWTTPETAEQSLQARTPSTRKKLVMEPATGKLVGLDMGINALITTSEGEQVRNPRWYRKAQADLRRKQRKLARAQKGSRKRQRLLRDIGDLRA